MKMGHCHTCAHQSRLGQKGIVTLASLAMSYPFHHPLTNIEQEIRH